MERETDRTARISDVMDRIGRSFGELSQHAPNQVRETLAFHRRVNPEVWQFARDLLLEESPDAR